MSENPLPESAIHPPTVKGLGIKTEYYPDGKYEDLERPSPLQVAQLCKYIIKRYVPRPHWTLEMQQPEGVDSNENQIKYSHLTFKGQPVEGGHWRNYEDWGPEYYQLTGSFIILVSKMMALLDPSAFEAQFEISSSEIPPVS